MSELYDCNMFNFRKKIHVLIVFSVFSFTLYPTINKLSADFPRQRKLSGGTQRRALRCNQSEEMNILNTFILRVVIKPTAMYRRKLVPLWHDGLTSFFIFQ